jgi:hypothetical protein
MRVIKLLFSAIAFIAMTSLFSCGLNCGDFVFGSDHNLTFFILDKHTKENILVSGDTQYNLDSVNVLNSNGSTVPRSQVRSDGIVYFNYVVDSDQGKVNQLISKRFFMHFNHQDNDTIDIAFNTYYDDCHHQLLKYIKISYNDSVYYEGKGNSGLPPNVKFSK